MNNIKFPEMDSNTSSDAGGEMLNSLNTKINNFKSPLMDNITAFASILTNPAMQQSQPQPQMQQSQPQMQQPQMQQQSQPQPQMQQQSQPVPRPSQPQPQPQPQQNRPQQNRPPMQQNRQQSQPQQQTQQPQQQQSQPQPQSQKTVSFDNNVHQKTISPNQNKSENNSVAEVAVSLPQENEVKKENLMDKFLPKLPSEFINIGSVKMPTKTLLLIVAVIGISAALFFVTREKKDKKDKKDKKKDDKEDEE
jgi:hypothetical protein